jgi:hypothetical protein
LGETAPPSKGWLGNPFKVSDYGREKCIEMYEKAFLKELEESWHFTNACVGLPGRVVACHCRRTTEDEPACHLDVVREALLDGTVFGVARDVHEISMADWKHEIAVPADEVL